MIHRALKVIRQFHEMKQTELSEKLGISKSYLCEIESGKKNISYDLLEKYSEIFDIKTSSLVFFSESLNSKNNISEKFRKTFTGKIIKVMEWVIEKDATKKETQF